MAKEQYFFFFGNTKIPNEKSELTGAEIKALIKDAVADFDTSHNLVLEGQGNEGGPSYRRRRECHIRG